MIDLLARRREMMGASGGNILPQGYTLLEYIENELGSDAYIISGIKDSNDIGFEVDGMFYDNFTTSSYGVMFGSRYANYNRDFGLFSFDTKGQLRLGGVADSYDANISQNTRYALSLISDTFTDGLGNTVTTTANLTFASPICIFRQGVFNSTSTSGHGHGKLYRLKFYKGLTLVRDYYPCISPNNEIGLYDLIGNQFYGSANSTPFTGG